LVNACWNLARREADRNLTIEDLCAETKASERVLRCAFQEMTSNSPALFLRNHRLHKARRMLLNDAPSVKDAAYSCGFTEMGRFSVYYRELFGESPSETLRSQSTRC
jgi:transcriptional regulator GlxA family with amidase domain